MPPSGSFMPPSGVSSPVASSQRDIHPRLESVVRRHRQTSFARPVAAHTQAACETLLTFLDVAPDQPWWLDAGCGTGESTLALAHRADAPARVVGVDKSAARLRRQPASDAAEVLLLRADLIDLWRLLLAADRRPARLFLLYPNPWPKPDQLRRRWHGHPVWPALWSLCPHQELRTNWLVYAREHARATALVGGQARIERWRAEPPISPHERKYARSGHVLWRVVTAPTTSPG